MEHKTYVIGLDFGTDSVRALLVDAEDGRELSTAVHPYSRWGKGLYCDPKKSQFRQHPLDHLEGMEKVIRDVLKEAGSNIQKQVKGMALATTGSTPGAVDENGTPLALLPGFEEDPDAMFVLWKDHTSNTEADEINELAHQGDEDFTRFSGGTYSTEWFWAKMLHVSRKNKKVAEKAYSWMENCDWVAAELTGTKGVDRIKRSRCAAGHKGMWNASYGGYPEAGFWEKLDRVLADIRKRLPDRTYTSDTVAGTLSEEWAKKLGLSRDVKVAVGALDSHLAAVGSGIEAYTMAKSLGTSTGDMVVMPTEEFGDRLVKGISGQVDGSIIPGMVGMEAGQSAFGDLYNWFVELLLYPVKKSLTGHFSTKELTELKSRLLVELSKEAETLPLKEEDVVALDWINGRRTPDADFDRKAAVAGMHLGTGAPQLFKALVEATAFGSKAIVERFVEEGIPVRQIIATGGIAKKSPYVMQTLADVINRPIAVVKTEQSVALGAAMFAAVVSGKYNSLEDAQKAMKPGLTAEYKPGKEAAAIYETLYKKYKKLGEVGKL